MAGCTLPDWDDVFMSAALRPERWLDSLDTMARHVGASRGQLIGLGGERDVAFNIVTDFEPSALRRFEDIGDGTPEVNFRVAASVRHMERGQYDPILFEKHYDEALPHLRSRRYVDLCDEFDIPYGCQTNLVVDGGGLIGLATLRARKDGRSTAPQRKIFAQAAQAARRAVRLQERLEGEQARFLKGAFDAIGICAFILDRRGHVMAHTASADALLSRGDIRLSGGSLDAAGTPIGLGPSVRSLVAEDGLANVRLRVDLPLSRQPLLIEGFRLPARSWSFGRAPHAVLIAGPPRRDRAGVSQFLTALYRLTAAEADIALRLAQGSSREEIAQARCVAAETLRGQIKSIHAKCEVANEAALMRLLAAFVA